GNSSALSGREPANRRSGRLPAPPPSWPIRFLFRHKLPERIQKAPVLFRRSHRHPDEGGITQSLSGTDDHPSFQQKFKGFIRGTARVQQNEIPVRGIIKQIPLLKPA